MNRAGRVDGRATAAVCYRLAAVLDAGERAALDGTSVISASPSAGHADGQSLRGHVARR